MLPSSPQDSPVELAVHHIKGFSVSGVSGVIGDMPDTAAESIDVLWQKFLSETDWDKQDISHDGGRFYAVYSGYDQTNTYPSRIVIGFKNSSGTVFAAQNDNDTTNITSGDYVIFSAQGPQPQALKSAWEKISKLDLKRTYAADFEVYGPRYFDPAFHEILICIGIKNDTT